MSIWDWPSLRGEMPEKFRLTLGEGSTPLVPSRRIGPAAGLPKMFFKLEGTNPTGSYKDRFAAAAVSRMMQEGKKRCVATSSGNTGSALAAYCAAAGIACEIAVVETAPEGKLKQMAAYGAHIFKVRGFGTDDAVTRAVITWVAKQGGRADSSLQISAYVYSPFGMSGVQSISYELLAQGNGEIEHVFVPAGGGGLTLAVGRGFSGTRVRVHCVQPEGNDTIATPLRSGAETARAVACTTHIGGLQVASVLDGDGVIGVCRGSGGAGHVVTDEAVWAMQARLAREEGIFCEPAGAVAVCGAVDAARRREVAPEESVCCIVTGIGFKDMPSVEKMAGGPCEMLSIAELSDR